MTTNEIKHPKGYWMGVGISIGTAIGAALGPIFDNFGTGIGIGIAIGAGLGTALEQRNKDNLRPLTEDEKRTQKRGIIAGMVILFILAVLFILNHFMEAG